MKRKWPIFLLTVAALLAGCADASAKVSNPNEALITTDDFKVTKEEVYELLRSQDGSETAMNMILKSIVDKEIETTDEITEEANAQLDAAKEQYGDSFADFLKYSGYADESDYLESYLLPQAKKSRLLEHYIEENWDDLILKYYPSQVQMMAFDTADAAGEALDRINAGEDFAEVASELSSGQESPFDGQLTVVSANDEGTLATNVTDFIKNNSAPTLSGLIQNDSATQWYIVSLVSKDALSFRNDAIAAIKESSTLETEMMAYYYKKYGFHTYDVTLRDYLEENYPTYLTQYPESDTSEEE